MKRLFAACALLPAWAVAQVDYTLNVNAPGKSISVSVRVAQTNASQEFRIPAWCPGFYFLQNYEKKIFDVAASGENGEKLEVTTGADARGWKVANPTQGPVTFSYKVTGDDGGLGFFGVSVQGHAAFINGPAAFVYLEGRKNEVCRLSVGKLPAKWQIATAMDPDQERFKSADYDEFIDHPIQLGEFERRTFDVEGTAFSAVFVPAKPGKMNADAYAEVEKLRAISAAGLRMMGGFPFRRYLYIVHLTPGSFSGGLEHRASNVINTDDFNPLGIEDLAAHEFFHSWNVKHIRPDVLGPFDYTKPVRTGNLWFAEGVTDYYAYRLTFQAALKAEQWMLETYSMQIAELQSAAKRRQKTVEEVSKGAWETGGFGDGDFSYYTKGSIMGLLFDAAIRDATAGEKSLDDVLRLLYRNHRLPKPGFPEDGLRLAINQVAGKDLSELYNRMARSTQELPYDQLTKIGLRLEEPGKRYTEPGITVRGGQVLSVRGPLEREGLRAGDVITLLNGKPFSMAAMAAVMPGENVSLEAKRGDQKGAFRFRMPSRIADSYRIVRDPFATTAAQSLLAGWLKR